MDTPTYLEAMEYYHSRYPFVVPSVDCIPKDWMLECIVHVLKVAECTNGKYPALRGHMKGYSSLLEFVNANVAAAGIVNPEPLERIWRYTRVTPLNNLRAIIIGQDPSVGINSDGLAFSNQNSKEVGASLGVVFRAIEAQTPYLPRWNADLTRWANKGALLINSIPTVGKIGTDHQAFGWLELNNMLLYYISDYYEQVRDRPLFVMAWGRYGKIISKNVLFDVNVQYQLQMSLLRRFSLKQPKPPSNLPRWNGINIRYHEYVSSIHPSRRNNGGQDFIQNGNFAKFRDFINRKGGNNIPWI